MKHENLLTHAIMFTAGALLMLAVFVVCSEELALYEGAMVCHDNFVALSKES